MKFLTLTLLLLEVHLFSRIVEAFTDETRALQHLNVSVSARATRLFADLDDLAQKIEERWEKMSHQGGRQLTMGDCWEVGHCYLQGGYRCQAEILWKLRVIF